LDKLANSKRQKNESHFREIQCCRPQKNIHKLHGNGHNTFLKRIPYCRFEPGATCMSQSAIRKFNHVADHFTKRATKSKDFGKIFFPQTCISFLGITLFILFDPQTPLPSGIG